MESRTLYKDGDLRRISRISENTSSLGKLRYRKSKKEKKAKKTIKTKKERKPRKTWKVKAEDIAGYEEEYKKLAQNNELVPVTKTVKA